MIKKRILVIIFLLSLVLPAFAESEDLVPVDAFFQYDQRMLLKVKKEVLRETRDYIQYHVTYDSAHDRRVTSLLTIPKFGTPPYPVVIYQHGMSERKEVEHIVKGTEKLIKEGFAVFSIDAEYHGEREKSSPGFLHNLLVKGRVYTFRDMFIQTVIDLRRGIDYLSKERDINKEKIGYIGISMGGIIGIIVSAVDKRIKAPIFLVAGGNFKENMPMIGMLPESVDILPIIDPIYFIDRISPHPILMINGLKDPSMMEGAKDLYKRAGEPKKIVWIDAEHVKLPYKDEVIKICVDYLKENLKGVR